MLPMDDDVSQSVDALVADDNDSTAMQHEYHMPARTSTPSIPPGFDLPHAHPMPSTPAPVAAPVSAPVPAPAAVTMPPPGLAPVVKEENIAKSGPAPRVSSLPSTAQFTPPRSSAAMHVPRVATPLSTVSIPPTPTPVPAVVVAKPNLSKSKVKEQAKEDVKSLAANSGLSKTIATQASQKMDAPVLQADDFPTLSKAAAKDTAVPSGPRAMNTASKKATAATTTTPAAASSTKPATVKKSTPGILNITLPSTTQNQASTKETPAKTPVSAKPAIESSAFPPLPPAAPATATVVTTAPKGPKTLRVLATPKTESPTSGATPPQSATSAQAPAISATRQSSIVPSTPASEVISDNASHTSATLSRPSSPPPTRIGSAPVRTTTKSQLKKARKEAMREKTELELELAAEHNEVEEIGPIMGRKKKQKKPSKTPSVPITASKASSRPQTPKIEKGDNEKAQKVTAESTSLKKASPVISESVGKSDNKKTKTKGSGGQQTPPEPPAPLADVGDDTAEKPTPTPNVVLQELRSHGEIKDPENLALLNPPPSYNHRSEFRGDSFHELDPKLVITEEDRAALLAGQPVHKVQPGGGRIMLTPNGDCVRNLSEAEEKKYLELQARIFKTAGPTAFVPSRHNATNGFTLIGGRAVPNGPPSFFPPLDGNLPNGPVDPVGKIQRDEALSYINQYVLPSLSTNSQLERALNANALDAEMLRPSDPQAWASWSTHNQNGNGEGRSTQEHTPYGGSRQDGILASGLESMTAHFAVGRENGRCQPLGNVTLLSLSDSENALTTAKKEHENLEKRMAQFVKKNRRLLGIHH